MNLNTSYGFIVLLSGILAILFGGGSLFTIFFIIVAIVGSYKCFKTSGNDKKQTNMAKIGIALIVIAVMLAFVFNWHGVIFELISKKFLG